MLAGHVLAKENTGKGGIGLIPNGSVSGGCAIPILARHTVDNRLGTSSTLLLHQP